jgi:ankyrin repeat protein
MIFCDNKNYGGTELCDSKSYLLMVKYILSLIHDHEHPEKEMIELCDYLCLDNVKQKYFDSHSVKYLIERDIIIREEYIVKLIAKKKLDIYFNNAKHFEDFLQDPVNTKYHTSKYNYNISMSCKNILFYIAHKKYNTENFINYGLFEEININCRNIYVSEYQKKYLNFSLNILMFSCFFSRNLSSNKIVKLLLNQPNIQVNSCYHIYRVPGKRIIKHYYLSILMFSCFFSKQYSSNETVKILLEHPRININLQNNKGFSSLMISIIHHETCSIEVIKTLLEHPSIDVNLQNKYGWTALTYAVRLSDKNVMEKIVKMLLEHPSIDVNLQTIGGWTPLMIAARESNTKSTENVVRMLLEHPSIDVNLQDKYGWTALILAAKYTNTISTENTVKMLLEHPEINVNLQIKEGWSALFFASKLSNISSTENTVKMLLEHPKINVNLYNEEDMTVLMLAALSLKNESTENTVRMILDHPKTILNIKYDNILAAIIMSIRAPNVDRTNSMLNSSQIKILYSLCVVILLFIFEYINMI